MLKSSFVSLFICLFIELLILSHALFKTTSRYLKHIKLQQECLEFCAKFNFKNSNFARTVKSFSEVWGKKLVGREVTEDSLEVNVAQMKHNVMKHHDLFLH